MKTLNYLTLQTITFTFLVVAGCTLTSCSPVLYTTVGQNVPMLQKKGEVAISGGFGLTGHTSGFNTQFAAAVSDKVVVMSSYYSLNAESSGGGTYFELGAGRYTHDSNNGFCSEILLGLGLGSIKNNFSDQTFININYIKPFVQPSIGFTSKVAEIAFTPRIAIVSYTDHSDLVTDARLRSNLDKFYLKSSTLAFEPGITLRLGYKNVKLQAQYNYTTFSYSTYDFNPVDKDFFSLGLHLIITDRWLSLKQNSK